LEKAALIHVAGHRGLVGSSVVRALRRHGYQNLLLRTHQELDLTEQAAVRDFLARERPAAVIMAAAIVGGIHANNSRPALFISNNLQIQDNLIDGAYRAGVSKLVFLGSSCIYPRLCPQPIREEYLLSGPLEPTNLYGPGDNFDLQTSHVLPALIRKFHEAKIARAPAVTIWGSGTPRREFLYVDDLAEAVVHLMNTYDSEHIINIGCGEDLTIRELAHLIASVVGYTGGLVFDAAKPDGTPRKLLDVTRLKALGWQPTVSLRAGIEATYGWFRTQITDAAA
jgi:GDP-L-fucose synthase